MANTISRRAFLAGTLALASGCATTFNNAELRGEMPVSPKAGQTVRGEDKFSLEGKVDERSVEGVYNRVAHELATSGRAYFVHLAGPSSKKDDSPLFASGLEKAVRHIDFSERATDREFNPMQRKGKGSAEESIAIMTYTFEQNMPDIRSVGCMRFDNTDRVGGLRNIYVLSTKDQVPNIVVSSHTVKGYNWHGDKKDNTHLSVFVTEEDPLKFKHARTNYRAGVEFLVNAAFKAAGTEYSLGEPLIGLGGYVAGRTARALLHGFDEFVIQNLFGDKDPADVHFYSDVGLGIGGDNLGSAGEKLWRLLRTDDDKIGLVNYMVPIEGPNGVEHYLIIQSDRPAFAEKGGPIAYAMPRVDLSTGYTRGADITTPQLLGGNYVKECVFAALEQAASSWAEAEIYKETVWKEYQRELEEARQQQQIIMIPYQVTRIINTTIPVPYPVPTPTPPTPPGPGVGGGIDVGGGIGGGSGPSTGGGVGGGMGTGGGIQ